MSRTNDFFRRLKTEFGISKSALGGDLPLGNTITESEIVLADNTTNNASATKHGFLKKLSNVAAEVLDGQGNFRTIAAILGFTPETVANKSTDVETDGASDTKYPSVKAVKDYVDQSGGGLGYGVYVALLTQEGAANPVATVLENTLGAIIWTRNGENDYQGVLADAFPVNKTIAFIGPTQFGGGGSLVSHGVGWTDASTIGLFTQGGDGSLVGAPIEIRVYP